MKKEEINSINFKELGKLQEKVLFYLAENPDKHKEAIQKGINYPKEQYSSIYNAVNALKQMRYLESRKAFSLKKVRIELYSCTDLGLIYAIGKNPDANIKEILDLGKQKYDSFKGFNCVYNELGKDEISKFFRILVDFLPEIHKGGLESALMTVFLSALSQNKGIDEKTRLKNAKIWMKCFPDQKSIMKKWQKNIKEIL